MGIQATQITHGIRITVETKFQTDQPIAEFLFSYFITIENKSDAAVQLISSHLDIFDSGTECSVINVEGVVGEKPVLEPGEIFEYESTWNLESDIGKMKGLYLMERISDKARFYVTIPEFELIVPHRLN